MTEAVVSCDALCDSEDFSIKITRAKFEILCDDLFQRCIAPMEQALNDAKGAFKTYEAALKSIDARKEAFNYSKERYNIGALNSFDLSQSQASYEQTQSEVIRAKYDYIFKLKVLEFYFGIPITNLN